MYEEKTRTLTRNLGLACDTLYGSASHQTNVYKYPAGLLSDKDYWVGLYEAGKLVRSVPVYVPDLQGAEYILSEQRGWGKMNNCLHTKSQLVNLPFLKHSRKHNYKWTGLYEDYFRVPSPAIGVLDLKDVKHLAIASSTVKGRAWWNMQPRFQSQISMANFLFELKDFRDVGGSLKNFKNLASIVFGNIWGRVPRKKRRTKMRPGHTVVGTSSGTCAEAVLTYNLAIAPMLKDAMAIAVASVNAYDTAQKQFYESGQRNQTSHYSEVLHSESEIVPGLHNNAWRGTGYAQKTVFTATLKYKYDYEMRNTREAFMHYWGLSMNNLEVLWNMLPFTFLLDYIFTVGKALHAMETDPNVDLFTTEYCESLKTTYSEGVHITDSPLLDLIVLDGKFHQGTGGVLNGTLIAGASGTKFERKVMDPYKGPALPQFRKPSGKQSLNTLALLRCFLD